MMSTTLLLPPSTCILLTTVVLLITTITSTSATELSSAFCFVPCINIRPFTAFTPPRRQRIIHHDYSLKQNQRILYQSLTDDDDTNSNLNKEEEETTPSSFSSLDMEELSHRIDKIRQFGPGLDESYSSSYPIPEHVYIILFRPGTEQEGAHTIEYPLGSGDNLMLAFESLEDCEEFGRVLEATDEVQFFDPKPQQMIYEALTSYCESIHVQVQFVPRGTELLPPTITVDQLDHDPALDLKVDRLNNLLFDDNKDEDSDKGGIDSEFEEESWG